MKQSHMLVQCSVLVEDGGQDDGGEEADDEADEMTPASVVSSHEKKIQD